MGPKIPLQIHELVSHYRDVHFKNVPNITIDNLTNFEFSRADLLRGIYPLVFEGQLSYILVSNFGIDEVSGGLKACFISTKTPEETSKWNCTMTFKAQGSEILNYTGKVFSIDDTLDIHSFKAGGLIYPKYLQDKFKYEDASFSFSIFKK